MPGDLELALRVRADMRDALRGVGALNRSLGETARRGGEAGAALDGAAGAAQALGALASDSGRVLDQAREATESAVRSMEDALVSFVRTGKLSFSSLVESIVADLARLAVRQAITVPLANAVLGALGPSPGGPTTGGGFGNATPPPTGFYPVGHAGLVAGQPGGVTRAVPPAIFAGAMRYHAGGIAGLRPDEVPIIAERGERVLPRGAAIAPPAVEINFHNRGTPQREVGREVRLDPRGLVVTIFTDDWNRRGPIRQTIERDPPGGGVR